VADETALLLLLLEVSDQTELELGALYGGGAGALEVETGATTEEVDAPPYGGGAGALEVETGATIEEEVDSTAEVVGAAELDQEVSPPP